MAGTQRIPTTRRKYNRLVANETLEDFALCYTAKRARHWSAGRIANTALGIVSFLVLEALGGTITLNYGVSNSLLAIAAVSLVVIFSGVPICYYAARYGVDVDLFTRGAGFGYIGSTLTSLIYATFTFIFFALEAAIMAMALQLLLGISLFWGYMLSAVVVIPLVLLGITHISRFQMWSQPLWLLMQVIPLIYVFTHSDARLAEWLDYPGIKENGHHFQWLLFGSASAVLLSVVAQIGEQVDFLRFMPEEKQCGRRQWWFAVLSGGPGWMLFGAAKLAVGSFLAWLAISKGIDAQVASDPAHMYQVVFSYLTSNPQVAVLCAGLFVIVSQLKINVANAYAGSLAWSNFFSRLTHNHPGRVVWMIFNVVIALMLMELGVYELLEKTLQIYSVFVLAWIGSIVADLIINKPLGLSPPGIEFKRSRLYDINPVGMGSMTLASLLGLMAHLNLFGDGLKAFASYLAFALPFVTAPFIAWMTRGRYYLVAPTINSARPIDSAIARCVVCEIEFEQEDMAMCPAYQGPICSLCCSLDVRCQDKCRPEATLAEQFRRTLTPYFPQRWVQGLTSSVGHFIGMMCLLSLIMAVIMLLAYSQMPDGLPAQELSAIAGGMIKAYVMLLIPIGIVSWLFVLARTSHRVAVTELRAHAQLLTGEMEAHRQTSIELDKARQSAETANHAKSRYLAGISHELRTPLNVLLGYAQLLTQDTRLPEHTREYAQILKRNGEHLTDLLEGLLEISKIEAGRLEFHRDEFNLNTLIRQLVEMFTLQAGRKGLEFDYVAAPNLPQYIATDKQRLRQILINLLNNAVKYTHSGKVTFRITYRNQVARFVVKDTGVGIEPDNLERIFKPFERIQSSDSHLISGTGLGLTIANSLADLMGGEIECHSQPGRGSCFMLKLMVSEIHSDRPGHDQESGRITGFGGQPRTLLIVDDMQEQRELFARILQPLGFRVLQADNGHEALTLAGLNAIDLFMLDITMPRMNGWQLAKKLRENNHHQPVLMVSANTHEIEKHNIQVHFHDDFITKPVSIDLLLAKLGKLLGLQWRYAMPPPQKATGSESETRLPSLAELKKLKGLAEIGFMSAFAELLDDMEKNGRAGGRFTQTCRREMGQCHFENIVRDLEGLINDVSWR